MSVPIPNTSAQREALLAGHRDAGGLVQWAKGLVAAAVETSGVYCGLRVGVPQEDGRSR